jgi:hypothetical protein
MLRQFFTGLCIFAYLGVRPAFIPEYFFKGVYTALEDRENVLLQNRGQVCLLPDIMVSPFKVKFK